MTSTALTEKVLYTHSVKDCNERKQRSSKQISLLQTQMDNRKESILTNDSLPITDGICKVSLIKPDKTCDEKQDGGSAVEREQWGRKLEFLLSVIGFAVDLGNVWRFPYICAKHGGGAFLVPYFLIVVLGGVPMFYMELLIGQFHRSGCISIWNKICPMFKGVGYTICLMALYVSFYYNTIVAWSLYYLYSSFAYKLPWSECNPEWANMTTCFNPIKNQTNETALDYQTLPAAEYFHRHVLNIYESDGLSNLGPPRWPIVLCLICVFTVIYFTLWKGVQSSGKVVWITATFPYLVLIVLLIQGLTLEGAGDGIKFYLTPKWTKLYDTEVWFDAATQVFFSLGPGFGTLIALSSYNQFNNNCYKDAIATSVINCLTSFMAGFVVFSVLGYMANVQNLDVEDVADQGPGLLFIVYSQALTSFPASPIFSIIFFSMLITLGLDSSFGGIEAVITAFCDEYPQKIGKRRKLFVFVFICLSFLGSLMTCTNGGIYMLQLMEIYATGPAIMTVVLIESLTVCWIYGLKRFCGDVEKMLSFQPGLFWKAAWGFISPLVLFLIIVMSLFQTPPLEYKRTKVDVVRYDDWKSLGWCVTCSSICITPVYVIYKLCNAEGSLKQRFKQISKPEKHIDPNRRYIHDDFQLQKVPE